MAATRVSHPKPKVFSLSYLNINIAVRDSKRSTKNDRDLAIETIAGPEDTLSHLDIEERIAFGGSPPMKAQVDTSSHSKTDVRPITSD